MSDVVVVAIVAALPAMGAVLVSLRNGQKSDAIHVLVNSNMSRVKENLEIAQAEIRSLRKLVDHLTIELTNSEANRKE